MRCFLKIFTQLAQILHDCRSRWSWQISTLLLHTHHLHFTILYTMNYRITCTRMTRQKAPRCNHDHPAGSPWHIFQLQSSFFHIHCSNPYNPCTIMTMMIMTMMMTSLPASGWCGKKRQDATAIIRQGRLDKYSNYNLPSLISTAVILVIIALCNVIWIRPWQ